MTSAFSSGAHAREPDEMRMGRKLEEQQLRGIAFLRQQGDQRAVADEGSRSALWYAKRFFYRLHSERAFDRKGCGDAGFGKLHH